MLAGEDAGPCTEANRREILNAFTNDLADQHWLKASKHYLGGGLQHGSPSFEPARRAHKELIKRGEYLQASMLDKVVAGATWHDGRGNFRLACHRCGAPATAMHVY